MENERSLKYIDNGDKSKKNMKKVERDVKKKYIYCSRLQYSC